MYDYLKDLVSAGNAIRGARKGDPLRWRLSRSNLALFDRDRTYCLSEWLPPAPNTPIYDPKYVWAAKRAGDAMLYRVPDADTEPCSPCASMGARCLQPTSLGNGGKAICHKCCRGKKTCDVKPVDPPPTPYQYFPSSIILKLQDDYPQHPLLLKVLSCRPNGRIRKPDAHILAASDALPTTAGSSKSVRDRPVRPLPSRPSASSSRPPAPSSPPPPASSSPPPPARSSSSHVPASGVASAGDTTLERRLSRLEKGMSGVQEGVGLLTDDVNSRLERIEAQSARQSKLLEQLLARDNTCASCSLKRKADTDAGEDLVAKRPRVLERKSFSYLFDDEAEVASEDDEGNKMQVSDDEEVAPETQEDRDFIDNGAADFGHGERSYTDEDDDGEADDGGADDGRADEDEDDDAANSVGTDRSEEEEEEEESEQEDNNEGEGEREVSLEI
ncbi:hypothetical protein CYLTODRAFT_495529 [Cylindrobasidium torrendii FP15055 ss-10]|uniref:Uncharacterized protein n=1 Tax=Cylindrobasidium torrendii FP15055 ss-10 TaxID=1314674 RepID=A0A0D7ARD1_9AGAR|nr:hypothetical protein CYLTODRAFT_495529 [Cylindrobasidium torrendii FP15055 ss-10]